MNYHFDIIFAFNLDNIIGIKECGSYSIPWPMIKEDMQLFKEVTTSCKDDARVGIIVGYNTWTTLPVFYKKVSKRLNLVISKNYKTDVAANGEMYFPTFEDALEFSFKNCAKTIVIGGSVIYDIALANPCLDKIYMTRIESRYPENIPYEHMIQFPLTYENFMEYVNDGKLKIESRSDRKIDLNKNVAYTFYTFKTTSDFSGSYLKKDKCPRLVFPKNTSKSIIPSKKLDEQQYLDLVKYIVTNGICQKTRNGTTLSIFGYQLKFDLSKGYPLSTVKRSYPKSIFEELMWMIRGQTNVKILQEKGVSIWNKNSDAAFLSKSGLKYKEGDIGPGYGFQMRHFGASYVDCETDYTGKGIDQLANAIDLLNNNPESRRIVIEIWNPTDISKMALPPCHMSYTFGVNIYTTPQNGKRGKLNCHLYQRSWDVFLGWNTTTAALLTYLLANHCDLDPGILVHSIADAHLYKQHIDSGAVDTLLNREVRDPPTLTIMTKRSDIGDYEFSDLVIENYYPAPAIIAEMIA